MRCVWIPLVLLSTSCTRSGGVVQVDSVSPSQDVTQQQAFARTHRAFDSYWHAGLAEISRYALTQTRYGEEREGDAVLVFVTEPFLRGAQVKHEFGSSTDAVHVLKLNALRRFVTGIYPYNIMTSSFAPTDGTSALKVTSSVSEWCGQAFAQLNRREGIVQAQLRSYFQAEGDEDFELPDVAYEDAIWQRIRRDPSVLPTGELRMIPAMHSLRLYHQELRDYTARATLGETEHEGQRLKRYELEYEGIARRLRIDFEPDFPHAIVAFEETTEGERTHARRTHAIMDAYWGHHGSGDEGLRRALGLR